MSSRAGRAARLCAQRSLLFQGAGLDRQTSRPTRSDGLFGSQYQANVVCARPCAWNVVRSALEQRLAIVDRRVCTRAQQGKALGGLEQLEPGVRTRGLFQPFYRRSRAQRCGICVSAPAGPATVSQPALPCLYINSRKAKIRPCIPSPRKGSFPCSLSIVFKH